MFICTWDFIIGMLTAGSRVNGFTDTITIYRARKRLKMNTNGMLFVAIETHKVNFFKNLWTIPGTTEI